jgi:glutathione S-transferase
MAVEMVAGYGWVILALVANVLLNLYMAMQVGSARRKYKVPYPTMYAIDSENKQAKLFNCVQRGHQNSIEYMPTFFAVLLIGGLQFPIAAAILGAIYNVGRFLYFQGYATGTVEARHARGGRLHWLALTGLIVCSIACALHQFFPDVV